MKFKIVKLFGTWRVYYRSVTPSLLLAEVDNWEDARTLACHWLTTEWVKGRFEATGFAVAPESHFCFGQNR